MFSMNKVCKRITRTSVNLVEALCRNQEEADTKLLLHPKHALDNNDRKLVLVRSPHLEMSTYKFYLFLPSLRNPSRSESTLILAMVNLGRSFISIQLI